MGLSFSEISKALFKKISPISICTVKLFNKKATVLQHFNSGKLSPRITSERLYHKEVFSNKIANKDLIFAI